ncbi:MAG TPA: methyl-accepting chemotaxis protein [Chthonomonadaceae bacterium]|nr:methyl-accepting chemotaxis protein [Chthonomonadaceae bacterium]
MRRFGNLKTAAKLGVGFGLCLLLMLALGTFAIQRMGQMHNISKEIATDPLPGTGAIGRLGNDIRQFRIFEFRYVVARDQAARQKLSESLKARRETIEKGLADYDKTITKADDRANFDELKRRWNDYLQEHSQVTAMTQQYGSKRALAEVEGRSLTQFFAISDLVDRMIAWNIKNGERLAHEAAIQYETAWKFVLTLIFVAALLGIGMALLVTRAIAPPLTQMAAIAEHLAVGEVNQTILHTSHDEVGRLADSLRAMIAYQQEMAQTAEAVAAGDLTRRVTPKSGQDTLGNAFAQMVSNLHRLIGQVADSSDTVAATSTQLSSSAEQTGQAANDIARTIQEVANAAHQSAQTSTEMAQGSEQQARAATEAAGAMERLQASITQVQAGSQQQKAAAAQADEGMALAAQAVAEVARSAQQMAQTAQQAATVAQTGGKAVEATITSMSRIQEQVEASAAQVKELGQKGQEIGAIVETIDQIAEQTNLLALNAAIEAARAGEHGKGFAVVADEVRKLAERATAATKEISALIGSVRAGVEEAVEAMEASHREVSTGAARSEEAGSALAQILQAAESVAAEVQGVTATAQEMAASVQSVQASVASVRQVSAENEHAITEMAAGAQQVSSAIATVASISQETAAGAEEMSASAEEVSASAQNVSAAVEEQTASIEEVSAAASELNSMAARLQELVSQFRLEEEAAGQPDLRLVSGSRRKAA